MGSTGRPARIVLVHGTWAASEQSVGTGWWQEGSEFWRKLNDRVGSLGRCVGTSDDRDEVFHWSGRNAQRDRLSAAKSLREQLARYEAEGLPYYLVAHSHGGNVVAAALAGLGGATGPRHLVGWLTVGTPFIHLHESLGSALLRIALMFLLLSLGGVALFEGWVGVAISSFTAALLAGWQVLKTTVEDLDQDFVALGARLQSRFAGSYLDRWFGLISDADEAHNALRAAAAPEPLACAPRLRPTMPSNTVLSRLLPRFGAVVHGAMCACEWVPAALFNWVLAPVLDRVLDGISKRRSFGIDTLLLPRIAVQDTPFFGSPTRRSLPLPEFAAASLRRQVSSSTKLAQMADKARTVLADRALGGSWRFEEIQPHGEELVHTTYFLNPDVTDLVCAVVASVLGAPPDASDAHDWARRALCPPVGA